ncbi:gamma-glutamylcyclotransferase [Billgrantia antri]|uniref:Gamma-glutamylcyclotransferase n=1 Tax=Halomonas sulfidivorans TaxID=2733488 RepID=A0ABX7WG94_9GAMM|nr:gamma-glutamylcyclotransferase family protein [Halomonas sulfidivorans]QTP59066.1 gamma-glutamylcyclotransferase [Halomonas sulfidivorans]
MRARHAVLAILMGLLVLLGWLWLNMLSPYTYDRPEHLADIEEGEHSVFVYGTLRFAPIRWLVMGRAGEADPAVLEGYRREGLDLTEAPGERVAGEVIEVDAGELERLDRYERLGIRYERVPTRLADGRMVWVYRRLKASQQPADAGATN